MPKGADFSEMAKSEPALKRHFPISAIRYIENMRTQGKVATNWENAAG